VNIYNQNKCSNILSGNWACPCCGEVNQNPRFQLLICKLEQISEQLDFSLPVEQAYRCSFHPVEAAKAQPGPHSIAAVHISVNRYKAYQLVMAALRTGINGIGVNQRGALQQRYIHLDLRDNRCVWLGA